MGFMTVEHDAVGGAAGEDKKDADELQESKR